VADQEQSTLREVLEENIAAAHAEAASDVTPVETAEQSAERARDEQGRFANKAESSEKPVKEAAAQAPEAAPVQEAAPPIPRPSSWKKEMWPLWDKLNTGAPLTPQETRQIAEYNSQREQQFASGVSTYKQEAERAKPIMEAIAPFQQEIAQAGAFAPQLIHNLLSAHQTLYRGTPSDKLSFLAKIAQDYGIPIQALSDPAVQQQYLASAPQQRQAPEPQAPDINTLVEQALSTREINQNIEAMQRDTQKYPFFHYVRSTMAQLLEQNVATDLDDAYHQALSAPEHSMLTTLQSAQTAQAETQKILEVQQRTVKAARANNVSVKSATPAVAATTNAKPSVRDALIESMAAHAGSARV